MAAPHAARDGQRVRVTLTGRVCDQRNDSELVQVLTDTGQYVLVPRRLLRVVREEHTKRER